MSRPDDLLNDPPQFAPWRPAVGIAPQLSDAELVTLAMMQAMLGFTSEARWLRHADAHLRHLFPYLPKQPGDNKRCAKPPSSSCRSAARWPVTPRCGATTCGSWTPRRSSADVPARPSSAPSWPDGPSTGTAQATRATSGDCGCTWCATLHGLPVTFALTGAKADERETLLDSSPWMRRYPQRGFSRASCSTRARTSAGTSCRPAPFGQVHFFRARRQRQASRVPGVTIRCRRRRPGGSLASAITARSVAAGQTLHGVLARRTPLDHASNRVSAGQRHSTWAGG
jgi:hypothetical protein